MPANLALVEQAVAAFGDLLPEVVFLGGAIVELLITDPAAAPVRTTEDVDVIVESATYPEYVVDLSEKLSKRGFQQDTREGAPMCRWLWNSLVLDIMPLQEGVLGFHNRWYPLAFQSAQLYTLPSGKQIRLISSPYFLATKFEAFHGRGGGGYRCSHDLEDIVAVIEGRATLTHEVNVSEGEVRAYLRDEIQALLRNPAFIEAVPGYLRPDEISQQRSRFVFEVLQAISA